MKVINPETNEEIEVFTQAEVAERDAKIAELTKKTTEQGENISQMSKNFEKVDEFGKKIESLETSLAEKEKNELQSIKDSALGKFHGGKENLKTELEASYAKLAGMPEKTAQEIAERSEMAAKLAGFSVDSRNPLYTGMSGEAPKSRAVAEGQKEKEDEFYKSDRGQAALNAMGLAKPAESAK